MKRFLIPPAMRVGAHPYKYGAKDAITNIKDIGKDGANFMKKNYNLKEPLFKKDPQGPNMNNLWTGYGYGGKGRALATIGLLGGGTIMASKNISVPAESEMQDVESLPSTRGDYQGYEAQLSENSGLAPSGDLVFAMHKTRHSGHL